MKNRISQRIGATVAILLLLLLAEPPSPLKASDEATSSALAPVRPPPAEAQASIYDQFVKEIASRKDAADRRHLATEIVTAANDCQIDPDLLFSLVAVESHFNKRALSRKGARGLGQVMYSTARAVAPTIIHRPADLYDVRRNLLVAGMYLRQLLIKYEGNLLAALTAYRDGKAGHESRWRMNHYVSRICTYFASLKASQDYEQVLAMNAGNAEAVPN